MSLRLSTEPINGLVVRINSREVRINPYHRKVVSAAALFFAAIFATGTIGFGDARADYFYECAIFVLAAYWCFAAPNPHMRLLPGAPLALILLWGLFQIGTGATVYRFATLQAALRCSALAATSWVAFQVFGENKLRQEFLRALTCFGAVVAVISTLAYFTSPGKILWMFDAPYPDIWGPFLSRNNLAQFLELVMPVALWLGLREPEGSAVYMLFGAIMLASTLASASRAGSLIVVLEATAVLWLCRKSRPTRRMAVGLALSTVLFAALPGTSHLAGRLAGPDPYQGRKEIAYSTLAMIRDHPVMGFGLGTYADVYPAYATVDFGHTVDHAHNDWLEWATEGGLPYAAVWVALALWSIRPAIRNVWGIGVLGCFLHAAVDYPFARLGISAWVFLLLGILAATPVERTSPSRPLRSGGIFCEHENR